MAKGNASITLIGVGVAKIGTEFVFNGPVNECETCKLKNTCLNLDVGRRYRIVTVRGNMKHDCALHDLGVKAVEVVESPVSSQLTLKTRLSARKSSINRMSAKYLTARSTNCAILTACEKKGSRFLRFSEMRHKRAPRENR